MSGLLTPVRVTAGWGCYCILSTAQGARTSDSFAMGSGQIAPTIVLRDLLEEHFPDEVVSRQAQANEEEAVAGTKGGGVWLPIFVCSLAFPLQACPLHIFEARQQ